MASEKTNMIGLYFLLISSIIANFVPIAALQMLGLVLGLVMIIAAYVYRMRASLNSLSYSHSSFLITTFWVGSFLLLIGLIIAVIWVYLQGNHAAIYNMMDSLHKGVVINEYDTRLILETYIQANMPILILSAFCTLSPGIAYFVYRLGAGLLRVLKGEHMSYPAAWFKI